MLSDKDMRTEDGRAYLPETDRHNGEPYVTDAGLHDEGPSRRLPYKVRRTLPDGNFCEVASFEDPIDARNFRNGLLQIRFENPADFDRILRWLRDGAFMPVYEVASTHCMIQEAAMNAGRAQDVEDFINLVGAYETEGVDAPVKVAR